MSRIFARKEFSNYLGEDRALNDIVVEFIPNTPTPTPSATITTTPTNTPTPTPTITPSATQPITTSGLILHLDASNPDNLGLKTIGAAEVVEYWKDLSPLDNNFIQSTTALKPLYQSDGFGSYQVNFLGTKYMSASISPNIASGITAMTKFIVFKLDNFNVDSRTNGADPSTSDFEGLYENTSAGLWAPVYYPGPRWTNFSGITKSPNFITWATKGQVLASMTGVTNDVAANNILFDTWSPEPALTTWYIGAGDNASNILSGSIREILIYDRILSQGEIDAIYANLKSKWNYSSW